MSRALADSLRWEAEGTQVFLGALDRVTDERLDEPTALPGWTRQHLVAHVAANADALVNLATWACTGVETPMYSSPGQRAADIAAGATRPAAELRVWAKESAERLDVALGALDAAAWQREVRTAQGRTVAATEVPWMRAREVFIHAVDLGAGVEFDLLPAGFVDALVDDITGKRAGAGDGPALALTATDTGHTWTVTGAQPVRAVHAPAARLAGWLAGRTTLTLTDVDGQRVPDLPAWL